MHLAQHDPPRTCRICKAGHPQHVNYGGKQARERGLLRSEHHLVSVAAHSGQHCLLRVAERRSPIARVKVEQPPPSGAALATAVIMIARGWQASALAPDELPPCCAGTWPQARGR